MSDLKLPRSFGTHNGSFHADEVTACALLLLFDIIDKEKIVRTRNLNELARCEYVCDVGGFYDQQNKLFDHHQADYQGPLSSAGMILLYLQDIKTITPKERAFFDLALITGVDAHDNGKELHSKGVCTYSHVISNFNPIAHDATHEDQQAAFFEALAFAEEHLERLWKRYKYTQSCRQIVAEAMKLQNEYLIFDKSIPWLEIFFDMDGAKHSAKFVIMPSGQHWKLRAIPPTIEEKMKVRLPLPQEWAGLLEDELKVVSGIKGAIFCHKGRFISVWNTREDAIEALQLILKQNIT